MQAVLPECVPCHRFNLSMSLELYLILTDRREPPIAPDSDVDISLSMFQIPHTGQRLLQTCLMEIT